MENKDTNLYIDSKELFQEIKTLRSKGYKNILVESPVESGKSSLVKDRLIGDNYKDNIKILANRTLLKEQLKADIRENKKSKDYDSIPEPYCYQVISYVLDDSKEGKKRKRNYIKSLADLEYFEEERILKALDRTEDFIKHDIQNVDYLILDEAHYFTSDSTFNDNTIKEYEYIMNNTNGTNIFMTATPETLIKAIREYEKVNNVDEKERLVILEPLKQITVDELNALDEDNRPIPEPLPLGIVEHVSELYTFEFIHERHREDRLMKELLKTNPKNKMVYFTNDKQLGNDIYQRYLGMGAKDMALKPGTFLCSLYDKDYSKYINHQERNTIVNSERFNGDLLVTTSVLDNGVNIKDKEVKRIVLDYVGYEQAIQMIGRVRTKGRAKDNPLHILFIIPSYQQLEKMIGRAKVEISKTTNLFKKAQLESNIQAYQDILAIKDNKNQRQLEYYTYFLKVFCLLTGGDVSFDMSQVTGLKELYHDFQQDQVEKEQQDKENEERKQRRSRYNQEKKKEQQQKELRMIECCCNQYLDKELLKDDFDILVEDLNLTNENNRLIKSESGINEELERLESKYRIEKEKATSGINRNKMVYRVTKI